MSGRTVTREPASPRSHVELRVLGPTEIRRHGASVAMRRRERDVLATLALHHPLVVAPAIVVETLWPDDQPTTAKQAVRNHVSRIRTVLGDTSIITDPAGYRLGPGWRLDQDQFDQHVAEARRASGTGDASHARALLRRALSLVRGAPFADLPDNDDIVAARARRRELHLAAEDEHLLALLDLAEVGHVADAVAEASALAVREPLREQRWMALALALYRHGSRRESLLALHEGRTALLEIAGLPAGPGMERLERLLLADDPVLMLGTPASLIGPRSSATRAPGGRAFVGRRVELDLVRGLLTNAQDSSTGRWIAVTGEEGCGKTELGQQVLGRAALDGWAVADVTCHPVTARPLEPLGDVLRQLLGSLDPNEAGIDPALLADLEPLWSDADTAGAVPLGDAVAEALATSAERRPSLIVLDDAHHLSDSAASLLRSAVVAQGALVVVELRRVTDGDDVAGGRRPEVGERTNVVVLGGLDLADTTTLVEELTEVEIPAEAAAMIHSTTRGNPLLVRHLAVDGPMAAAGSNHSIGELVHRLVAATLERSPPEFRRLAAVLAVASAPLPVAVLAATSDVLLDVLAAAVDDATSRGLLRRDGDGGLTLASDALRTTVLDGVEPTRQDELHDRLGRALLDHGASVLTAAPHVLAVADRNPVLAIEIAERAGRLAHRSTMFAEAARFFRSAADVVVRESGVNDAHRLSLMLLQAESLRRLGDASQTDLVWEVVRRADDIGDSDMLARAAAALCKTGPLIEAGSVNDEVAEVVERAIAGCTDTALRAMCAGQSTLFYSLSGRVDLCLRHFHDALDHARRSGDDRVMLEALGNVYASLIHPDDWPLRAELAGEMLTLAERVDDDDMRFEALHLYFSTQIQFGDPLLRTAFERQARLAARLRSAARRWMAGYQRACIAFLEGRLDDAIAINDESVAAAPVAPSRAAAGYWMNLVVVRLAQGRSEELAADIDHVIEQQPGLPGWRAIAAWIAAQRGDTARVLAECEELDDGARLPRDMSWSGAAVYLARAAAFTGDVDRCARLRILIEPYAGLMTWLGSVTVGPFDLALAELALVAGDIDAAERHLAGARRIVHRLGATVFAADLDRTAEKLQGRRASASG